MESAPVLTARVIGMNEGTTEAAIAPCVPPPARNGGRLRLLTAGLFALAVALAVVPFIAPPIGLPSTVQPWAWSRIAWLVLLLGYALAIPFLIGAVLGSLARADAGRVAGRGVMVLYALWVATLWSVSGARPQVGVPLLVRPPAADAYHFTQLTMLLLNLYLFNAIGMHGGRFGASLRRRMQAPPDMSAAPNPGAQHEA